MAGATFVSAGLVVVVGGRMVDVVVAVAADTSRVNARRFIAEVVISDMMALEIERSLTGWTTALAFIIGQLEGFLSNPFLPPI